jgi:hypothetical protein
MALRRGPAHEDTSAGLSTPHNRGAVASGLLFFAQFVAVITNIASELQGGDVGGVYGVTEAYDGMAWASGTGPRLLCQLGICRSLS